MQWYEALFKDSRLVDGFLLSFRVAIISGTLSAVLGTLAAFVLVRYKRFAGRTLFSGMNSAPLVMPEVIIGLSLMLFMKVLWRSMAGPRWAQLPLCSGMCWWAWLTLTVVVQSRLAEMDHSIEEAAMDLGCRPLQVFMLVTLPCIAPGIIAAWLLAFTLSFDDLVISEFLSGPGVTTLPQVIFSYARRGINPTIYAAAALLILW